MNRTWTMPRMMKRRISSLSLRWSLLCSPMILHFLTTTHLRASQPTNLHSCLLSVPNTRRVIRRVQAASTSMLSDGACPRRGSDPEWPELTPRDWASSWRVCSSPSKRMKGEDSSRYMLGLPHIRSLRYIDTPHAMPIDLNRTYSSPAGHVRSPGSPTAFWVPYARSLRLKRLSTCLLHQTPVSTRGMAWRRSRVLRSWQM